MEGGLITFLGTHIHVACGGWGGGGLIMFLGTRIHVACGGVGWGGTNNVPWHAHLCCHVRHVGGGGQVTFPC